mgnify:CR=1 FL=1
MARLVQPMGVARQLLKPPPIQTATLAFALAARAVQLSIASMQGVFAKSANLTAVFANAAPRLAPTLAPSDATHCRLASIAHTKWLTGCHAVPLAIARSAVVADDGFAVVFAVVFAVATTVVPH